MKKNAILLALALTTSIIAIAAPPPNTLNMQSSLDRSAVAQDAFSAVGMLNLPPDYSQVVSPNQQSVVADQVQQYESGQLTPAQLKRLQQVELDRQRVLANPYNNVPAPIVRSINPDLSAGKTPPVIRVSKNLLTTVVFTDLAGNPWYIDKVIVNRDQFNDSASVSIDGQPTNILTLEPTQAIQYGTVSIMLKGKTMPVIFLLSAGQNEVDIRVDARMSGTNPDQANANIDPSSLLSVSGVDESSLGFLDGYIPQSAEQLQSSDGGVTAWLYNNQTYVKTKFNVLYPSFHSRATTADGVNIYRFETNPKSISFLQRGGQPVTASFTEQPYLYDN